MFNAHDDPLGLGLEQRARARRQQMNAEADASDQSAIMAGSPMAVQSAVADRFNRGQSDYAAQSYNSGWDKFFQSLREQQDDAESKGMKFKVDSRNMGNAPMVSLQNDAPMPESHDAWMGRTKRAIYGPMDSLKRGR